MKLKPRSILLGVVVLAACETTPMDVGHPVVPRDSIRNLTVQEQVVASASNQFALTLLSMADASETRPNFMLSPLSANMALGMTLNGAANGTYDAMRAALGLGSMSQSQANAAYAGLIRQLYARAGDRIQFTLANSVWCDNDFKPLATFVDTLKMYFDAEVKTLDFNSPTAPQTISQWAADKTNGRVKDLVKSIDPSELMFLVNAVYFKAPWTKAFDSKNTFTGSFTRSDGSRVSVQMMSRQGVFKASAAFGATAVELPYADSAYTILLWMPASATNRWVIPNVASDANVILNLPKFRIEYDLVLNTILTKMGMGVAFTDGADFSRIAGTQNLAISKVFQKTFIDVNEEGTEAAAATSVGIQPTSAPPSITFDKPFLFAIREKSTGTILFAGRVNDPSK